MRKLNVYRCVSFYKNNKKIFFRFSLLLILALLAGCASTPEIKSVEHKQPPIVEYALSLQGAPYRWGKESPEEGFDCSGFVMYVYGKHGIRLPRTAREMAHALPPIPKYDLRSGDLVFFNTRGPRYSHVGIYINHGKFIHAPNRRIGKVMVSSMDSGYWRKHFVGVRRPLLN
jgi:cell wall-associated NlpC family hydrolase